MQISNPVRVASIVSESYCPDCITYSHKKCTEIHLDPLTCRDGSCVRAVEESPSHARATIRIKALSKGKRLAEFLVGGVVIFVGFIFCSSWNC